MKSLTQFWQVMAKELAMRCRVSATAERDYKTFSSRFEHEGDSFLTVTLPTFGKDFERCLELKMVDPDMSFHSWKFHEGTPRFLGGFLDRVFDRQSGDLLDDPCVFSIHAIRQLTLVFGKMFLQCSEKRTADAYAGYIETDRTVGEMAGRDSTLRSEFRQASAKLWAPVFNEVEEKVRNYSLTPGHGPGSTAERIVGNDKFYQFEWTDRLEAIFPYGEYCLPSWRYKDRLDDVTFLAPEHEMPVRVISVPKTQLVPRIIALEPVCMQYVQQALMKPLVRAIEGDFHLGRIVGFTDQSRNQQLAREGSLYGRLATLDLSEASDRVSLQHAVDLFHRFPLLRDGVLAARSTHATVPVKPGGPTRVIKLNKFASMGSALCFPVEAMVFTTVIAVAIANQVEQEQGLEAARTRSFLLECLDGVRVYGDDIVVPAHYVDSVIQYLEAFGFKVNTGKSFWKGKFRESCGKEYFDGHDVSIVRVRQHFPQSRKDAAEVVSLVSLRNQVFEQCLYDTAEYLDGLIRNFLPVYPKVYRNSPVLGRWTNDNDETIDGMCPKTHNPVVKGYVVKSKSPLNEVDEEFALLKHFLKPGTEPFQDKEHLLRSGRPDAVYLKRRTVVAYETVPPARSFRPGWVSPWLV